MMGLGQHKQFKTPLTGVILGTAIGLAVAYGLAVILPWRPPPQAPDFAAAGDPPKTMFNAPEFTGFVNQLGKPISSKDLAGKVLLVTFMYPYCTRVCPIIASRMVNLEYLLRERHLESSVRFISFNVDPSDSTPEAMSRFMQQYGADPHDTMWQFLMASPAQTERVVKNGYHAGYEKIPVSQLKSIYASQREKGTFRYGAVMDNPLAEVEKPSFAVLHSTAAIIVGPNGVVRYVLGDADTVSAAAMVNDIIRVLRAGKPA